MRRHVCALALLFAAPAGAASQPDYAADAAALDRLLTENYAYQERWPGGILPDSSILAAERAAVRDDDALLRYAEHRIASLADHHAITGGSFKNSWGLIPTYADLWIEERGSDFVITAVRDGSPAENAGIRRGDRLTAVDDVPIAEAVEGYWRALGLNSTPERRANAARVLAAGRRDRPRKLTTAHGSAVGVHDLPNLYSINAPQRPPVTVTKDARGRSVIRVNNALGDNATIAAFDLAMASLPADATLVIDLTDTPSGGNTSVARAIMGWFVAAPTSYQVHSLPGELRETGIARQWIEQVLPRTGKYRAQRPTVMVGRWTGSMGEGLAIGFKALGARVCGDPMAGLLGAIYDINLPSSGMTVKFPVERLQATWGQAREDFQPERCA